MVSGLNTQQNKKTIKSLWRNQANTTKCELSFGLALNTHFYPKWLILGIAHIWSVLAMFSGIWTHDLWTANTMCYQLSYKLATGKGLAMWNYKRPLLVDAVRTSACEKHLSLSMSIQNELCITFLSLCSCMFHHIQYCVLLRIIFHTVHTHTIIKAAIQFFD